MAVEVQFTWTNLTAQRHFRCCDTGYCHASVQSLPQWFLAIVQIWKQGSIPSIQSQNCCHLITAFWHVDLIIWPSALNPEPRRTSGTTGGCSSGKGCKDTKWYKRGQTIYDSSWWALSHITDEQWDSSKVPQPSRKFWKVCGNAGIRYLSQAKYTATVTPTTPTPPLTTNTNSFKMASRLPGILCQKLGQTKGCPLFTEL